MQGYNSMVFDRPFLQNEFRRVEEATGRKYTFPPEGTREIDAMKIFRSLEPRPRAARGGVSETSSGYGSVVACKSAPPFLPVQTAIE